MSQFKSQWEKEYGLPSEILHYLKANTTLANNTISELKKEDSKTIRNIFIGAILSFILTTASSLILLGYKQSETTELKKQIIELNKNSYEIQNDYRKLNLELTSLKNELLVKKNE